MGEGQSTETVVGGNDHMEATGGYVKEGQPPESGIGVVGNKKVTSKGDYKYQQLDGEASISCH